MMKWNCRKSFGAAFALTLGVALSPASGSVAHAVTGVREGCHDYPTIRLFLGVGAFTVDYCGVGRDFVNQDNVTAVRTISGITTITVGDNWTDCVQNPVRIALGGGIQKMTLISREKFICVIELRA